MSKFIVCWLLQFMCLVSVFEIVSCQNRYSDYARVNDGDSDMFSDNEKKLKTLPQDLMIDVTNRFGMNILYSHSMRNKNNIALSPCGLASVMIALFEGADGKSAIEIHKALDLPWDRDIVRIGLRDIHRRLRTYFYKSENILTGLSLSRENITFRTEYENILRFYGYEVSSLKPDTNMNPMVNEMNETTAMSKNITTSMPIMETTTMVPDEEITSENRLEEKQNKTTTDMGSHKPTTMESIKETNTIQMKTNPETTTLMSETDKTECDEYIDYDDTTPITTETVTDGTTELLTTSPTSMSVLPLKRRDTRSVMEYEVISNYDEAQEPNNYDFHPIGTPTPIQPQYNDYDESFKSASPDTDLNHLFYLTNFETIRVPYKFFNTILKYAYIEELRSAAIELQLDSENYNMLILLPDFDYALDYLQYDLTSKISLRDIKKALRLTWIKAIVPQFNLKGNIILTSDLQNLGIFDIFEPTHADFTPMTHDSLVYTRHIEQAVTVNIRTQRMEQLLRQSFFKSPVEISVNHPFLFFVIDTEIDLAIINGRVLNPLNSRIQ